MDSDKLKNIITTLASHNVHLNPPVSIQVVRDIEKNTQSNFQKNMWSLLQRLGMVEYCQIVLALSSYHSISIPSNSAILKRHLSHFHIINHGIGGMMTIMTAK